MFLTSFIKTFQTSWVNSKKWRGDQYQAKTKLLHQILKKIQCRKLGKSKKNLKIVMKRSRAMISEQKSVLETQEIKH